MLRIVNIILSLIFLLISFALGLEIGEAKTYSKLEVYNQIIKNNPKINIEYAKKLSNIIYTKTKKYNIDSQLFTAILAQESMYRLNIKNCNKKLECMDYGISQIYKKTAKAYKFDLKKLLTDLEYSVEAGVIVLSDFKKWYAHKETYWWTRYNSSNRKIRKKYKKLVEKYK